MAKELKDDLSKPPIEVEAELLEKHPEVKILSQDGVASDMDKTWGEEFWVTVTKQDEPGTNTPLVFSMRNRISEYVCIIRFGRMQKMRKKMIDHLMNDKVVRHRIPVLENNPVYGNDDQARILFPGFEPEYDGLSRMSMVKNEPIFFVQIHKPVQEQLWVRKA